MRARRGASHIAIVGLGINITQTPEDFSPQVRATAISLESAASRPVDRLAIAVALLRELNRTYPPAEA
jgi:BirA family biotin operon repressor/biotin-[acetyl-CoA-carboxylase] ligase